MFLAAFVCAIGSPAILGVWTMRLWHGQLDKDAEFANPTGIAIGISLVIATSIIAAVVPELQRDVGPWVIYLGVFAAFTFAVGLFVGWAEQRAGKS